MFADTEIKEASVPAYLYVPNIIEEIQAYMVTEQSGLSVNMPYLSRSCCKKWKID
jgi:hypothetical protein